MSVLDEMDPASAQEAARTGPPPDTPNLASRHVVLRPVTPVDIGALYALSSDPAVAWRWRHRGRTPAPEVFAQAIWNDVLVQFVVSTPESPAPIGLVSAYHADQRNGTVYLAAMMAPAMWQQGWPLEAMMLLIDYLFKVFPMRKVYLESLEFNADQYGSAVGRFLVEEGRLVGHEYHNGRWVDMITYALYRETWEPLDAVVRIGGRPVD